MENTEKTGTEKDERGCCAKSRCCCGGKALAAVGLIAVGALGGWLASRHCCAVKDAPAAAAPAK